MAPAPVAAPKRAPGGSSRILDLALAVAVVVGAVGVAFAIGRATAPAASTGGTIARRNGRQPGPAAATGTGNRGNGFPNASVGPNGLPGGGQGRGIRGFGAFGGGLTITGTVESVAADSITIKLPSGQTVTVGLDGTTTYHQQAPASASDVTAGKTVQLQLSGGFRPGRTATAALQRRVWSRSARPDPSPSSPDQGSRGNRCTCSWSRTTRASPDR